MVSKGGKIDSSNSIAEMISDNYSEDFQQSSDHNQVESSRFSNSKKKLQDKARDLTQSAQSEQYSEDDFENSESVAQSQPAAPPQERAPVVMESVREESVEDPDSKSDQLVVEDESVPSADLTVQESAHSVDWQVHIPQDSHRADPPDYSQDGFEPS